jgi:hypothetical protein
VARPALVLDVRVNAEERKAALIVAYGTGVLNEATQGKTDLIIDDWDEVRAIGLHKPTRFALSAQSRMQLPWCAEYFVPPMYLATAGIIAGSLDDGQIRRLIACLAARNLKPYA